MLPLTLAPCSHGALQQGHIVLIQERIMMSWVCPLASQGVGRAMADENPNSPSTGVAQPVVQFLYYIFFKRMFEIWLHGRQIRRHQMIVAKCLRSLTSKSW